MDLCFVNKMRTSKRDHFFCVTDSLSEVAKSWLVFIFVFVVVVASIYSSEVLANGRSPKAKNPIVVKIGDDTQLAKLAAKTKIKGKIPIIVRLDADFKPEGKLPGGRNALPSAAVKAQRNAISNKQNAVVQSLVGETSKQYKVL